MAKSEVRSGHQGIVSTYTDDPAGTQASLSKRSVSSGGGTSYIYDRSTGRSFSSAKEKEDFDIAMQWYGNNYDPNNPLHQKMFKDFESKYGKSAASQALETRAKTMQEQEASRQNSQLLYARRSGTINSFGPRATGDRQADLINFAQSVQVKDETPSYYIEAKETESSKQSRELLAQLDVSGLSPSGQPFKDYAIRAGYPQATEQNVREARAGLVDVDIIARTANGVELFHETVNNIAGDDVASSPAIEASIGRAGVAIDKTASAKLQSDIEKTLGEKTIPSLGGLAFMTAGGVATLPSTSGVMSTRESPTGLSVKSGDFSPSGYRVVEKPLTGTLALIPSVGAVPVELANQSIAKAYEIPALRSKVFIEEPIPVPAQDELDKPLLPSNTSIQPSGFYNTMRAYKETPLETTTRQMAEISQSQRLGLEKGAYSVPFVGGVVGPLVGTAAGAGYAVADFAIGIPATGGALLDFAISGRFDKLKFELGETLGGKRSVQSLFAKEGASMAQPLIYAPEGETPSGFAYRTTTAGLLVITGYQGASKLSRAVDVSLGKSAPGALKEFSFTEKNLQGTSNYRVFERTPTGETVGLLGSVEARQIISTPTESAPMKYAYIYTQAKFRPSFGPYRSLVSSGLRVAEEVVSSPYKEKPAWQIYEPLTEGGKRTGLPDPTKKSFFSRAGEEMLINYKSPDYSALESFDVEGRTVNRGYYIETGELPIKKGQLSYMVSRSPFEEPLPVAGFGEVETFSYSPRALRTKASFLEGRAIIDAAYGIRASRTEGPSAMVYQFKPLRSFRQRFAMTGENPLGDRNPIAATSSVLEKTNKYALDVNKGGQPVLLRKTQTTAGLLARTESDSFIYLETTQEPTFNFRTRTPMKPFTDVKVSTKVEMKASSAYGSSKGSGSAQALKTISETKTVSKARGLYVDFQSLSKTDYMTAYKEAIKPAGGVMKYKTPEMILSARAPQIELSLTRTAYKEAYKIDFKTAAKTAVIPKQNPLIQKTRQDTITKITTDRLVPPIIPIIPIIPSAPIDPSGGASGVFRGMPFGAPFGSLSGRGGKGKSRKSVSGKLNSILQAVSNIDKGASRYFYGKTKKKSKI